LPANKKPLYSIAITTVTGICSEGRRLELKISTKNRAWRRPLTGESRGRKIISSLTRLFWRNNGAFSQFAPIGQRSCVCPDWANCAIPAKIRNRQEQPITIRDRRPRHRIASRYCLNTSQVCTNSPRAGYSSSSGVDCRPKTTSRDQRESVCVGELFAIIQRACHQGL